MRRGLRRAIRAAIVLGAIGVGYATLREGLATVLASTDPARAARIAPGNARADVAAANALISAGADAQSPEVGALAKRALARDATIPGAIELRGLAADVAGERLHAAQMFALSDAVSRRSLPTRTWLIQQSVDRGDVVGALENFDIALRTSDAAPVLLFPVLTNASIDPKLQAAIARVLDRDPPWATPFLRFAIAQGSATHGVAAIMLRMRDRPMLAASGLDQLLTARLLAERRFADVARAHDAFDRPLSTRALLADPRFNDASRRFPFGWALVEGGDAGAERANIGGRPALSWHATTGGAGAVASQLLMLTPGNYALTVASAVPPSDPAAPPFWTLTCGDLGGAQLAILDQPRAKGSARFVVTSNCTAQWLALALRSSSAPGGQSGTIASVAIARR